MERDAKVNEDPFLTLTAIIWKEPLWKEGWKGYQYGLKVIQIIKEDFWKLQLLLRGKFNLGGFSFGPWETAPDSGGNHPSA